MRLSNHWFTRDSFVIPVKPYVEVTEAFSLCISHRVDAQLAVVVAECALWVPGLRCDTELTIPIALVGTATASSRVILNSELSVSVFVFAPIGNIHAELRQFIVFTRKVPLTDIIQLQQS